MQPRISILTAYQDFPFYAIPYGTCDLASRLALKITNAPVVGVTFSIFLLFIVFVYFEVEHDYFLVISGDRYYRLLFKFLEWNGKKAVRYV